LLSCFAVKRKCSLGLHSDREPATIHSDVIVDASSRSTADVGPENREQAIKIDKPVGRFIIPYLSPRKD
jgi:hypothetical protein